MTIRRVTGQQVQRPPKPPQPETRDAARASPFGWQPKTGTGSRPAFVPARMAGLDKIRQARDSGDPKKLADALHGLAKDRIKYDAPTRVALTRELFAGVSAEQAEAVRAAYIAKYDIDPELHIRSDGWGQPLARLDRTTESAMVGALNGATLTADAQKLHALLDKANAGTLTQADRAEYFAMMPRLGLWDAPVRAAGGDKSLDALERGLIEQHFGAGFDQALKTIEGAMPPADLAPKAPRERSIAVIASSHGAQWQELMGWATKMKDAGYDVQVFTPEGRPVAMQRDSLSVFKHASGFGSPPKLDPAGHSGDVARELLGNTAAAKDFDPKRFGAVYLAGGLGFNEDVAVAMPGQPIKANPNIEKMMNAATDEKLPIIALCHAPTLLSAVTMDVGNGQRQPINRGIQTASLPPFEGYVGLTGRKELQFTYDVNTHHAMEASGGTTSVLKDIANMSRVVKQEKAGVLIYTGPGPQAAEPLADATIAALKKRWQ